MIPKRFTKDQQAAYLALVRLLENPDLTDLRYDSLSSSRGGKIISTDIARSLDTRYRDTPTGQARDLIPGWDLACCYAHDRLVREIQSRGHRKIIRFMAGGWGAGKPTPWSMNYFQTSHGTAPSSIKSGIVP